MEKCVLIVDDHLPMVRMIREVLERHGYSLLSATDGQECLEAVEEACPDLIILDLTMPVMDGMATLQQFRQRRETRSLPVIILSGAAEYGDVLQGFMSAGRPIPSQAVRPGGAGERR